MRRLKVLVLTQLFPRPDNPALGAFVAARVAAMSRLADVRVFAPVPHAPPMRRYSHYRNAPRAQLTDEGVQVWRPRYVVAPKTATFIQGPTMYRAALAAFKRYCGSEGWWPDVIDGHFAFPDGYAAVRLGARLEVPATVTCHGTDLAKYPSMPLAGALLRRGLKAADRVVGVSPQLARCAVELGCRPQNVRLLVSGVDDELFRIHDKNDCRRLLGLPREGYVVVCVASLDPNKNQRVLLEALALMKRQSASEPLPYLVLLGQGPSRQALQQQTHAMGLESNVIFAGTCKHDQVPIWLSAADCLALASKREGWPTVYYEAMACGLPVLTSAVDAAKHAIEDQRYGSIVWPNSGEAFAAAITEARKRSFDTQLLRSCAQQHTWRAWAQSMLALFLELCPQAQAQGAAT